MDAYNAKVKGYNEAFDIADGARTKEKRAHHELAQAMQAVNGDGWLENLLERLGFAPSDGMDAVTGTGWGLGLAGVGLGMSAGWMIQGKYGIFQPRTAAGRWGRVNGRGMDFWDRARAAGGKKNWHARAGNAAVRGKWATAGKIASRAGYAVTAVTSGWQQWQADADDPSLDTSERVSRAVTKSAATRQAPGRVLKPGLGPEARSARRSARALAQ
ncbi:MAG: hypothetical protein ACRDPH_04230 [Marmoricola sp.]